MSFSKTVLRSGEIPGSDGGHNKPLACEFNPGFDNEIKSDGSIALQLSIDNTLSTCGASDP
jgi:hypothetical protein